MRPRRGQRPQRTGWNTSDDLAARIESPSTVATGPASKDGNPVNTGEGHTPGYHLNHPIALLIRQERASALGTRASGCSTIAAPGLKAVVMRLTPGRGARDPR